MSSGGVNTSACDAAKPSGTAEVHLPRSHQRLLRTQPTLQSGGQTRARSHHRHGRTPFLRRCTTFLPHGHPPWRNAARSWANPTQPNHQGQWHAQQGHAARVSEQRTAHPAGSDPHPLCSARANAPQDTKCLLPSRPLPREGPQAGVQSPPAGLAMPACTCCSSCLQGSPAALTLRLPASRRCHSSCPGSCHSP